MYIIKFILSTVRGEVVNSAVRYCSVNGKTELVAEAIAKGAGTDAVSVESENAVIDQKTDVLFIGASIHSGDIEHSAKSFIYHMSLDNADNAVVFSTSFSPRAIMILRKHLYRKGVVIQKVYNVWRFPFCKPSKAALKRAEKFARKYIENKENEKNEVFV